MTRSLPSPSWSRRAITTTALAAMTLFLSACPSDTGVTGDTTDTTSDATTDTSSTDTGVTTPPPTGADPCAEIGSLEVKDFNDHCKPTMTLAPAANGSGSTTSTAVGDDNIDWAGVLARPPFNLWVWPPLDEGARTLNCPNPIVAIPGDLLIGVDSRDSSIPVNAVKALLDANNVRYDPPEATEGSYLYRISLNSGVTKERIVELLPLLQGPGWSTGFNYVEFAQPNYGLRPYDDPERPVSPPPPTPLGTDPSRVLVVDSPTDQEFPHDRDQGTGGPGDGYLDESSGHGEFVQSLIKGQLPNATVDLAGIIPTPSLKLKSERWAPMMFSDIDVELAFKKGLASGTRYDVVNLSLGGAGCPSGGLDERMALARALRGATGGTPGPRFVAAAGNAGNAGLHYPAAWRSTQAFDQMSAAVAQSPNPDATQVIKELSDLRAYYENNMLAVGSVETGRRANYSNCGAWINAAAEGTKQVADYPTASGPIRLAWSGTSFAAANVSAQLAAGLTPQSPPSDMLTTKGTDC